MKFLGWIFKIAGYIFGAIIIAPIWLAWKILFWWVPTKPDYYWWD